MIINFENLVTKYIENKQGFFEKLQKVANNIGSFECVSVEKFDMKFEAELLKKTNVLYFFKIKNDKDFSDIICQEIEKLKAHKNEKKLPKVNSKNKSDNILYVGKSSGIFSKRLKEHFGRGSNQTYALHFDIWKDIKSLKKLELELYYLPIDLECFKNKSEASECLEYLETILHFNLKPILGRTGH